MSKKYINIDLDDPRIGNLADVISNKTSKRIIDYLSDVEASEAEISKDLKLPANTVNYNVKKLLKAGLIDKSKDHWWSVKGKKIVKYSVASKKIVISPRSLSGVKQTFVALAVSGVAALGLKSYFDNQYLESRTQDFDAVVGGSSEVASIGKEVASDVVVNVQTPEIALWFFLGALLALAVYFTLGKMKAFR
jgi:DNA-binding transcriptional ArsR family regulator